MVLESYPLERSVIEANPGRVDGKLYRQDGITALPPRLLKVPVVATVLAGLVSIKAEGFTNIGFLSPPLQVVPVFHYLHIKRESRV